MLDTIRGRRAAAQMFWGELAPCDHVVQIYEHDDVFLEALEEFVCSGLHAGESVVIVATPAHASDLGERLTKRGFDLGAEQFVDNYIVLDAEETLSRFVRDGWPDEDEFRNVITGILHRAGSRGRKVRAFGEMVAVLWANGHNAATVRLEHLWHELIGEKEFALFCAYPKAGFTKHTLKSLQDICDAHSRVIG